MALWFFVGVLDFCGFWFVFLDWVCCGVVGIANGFVSFVGGRWSVALGLWVLLINRLGKRPKWRYKPLGGKKDQNGRFLNAIDFISISPNLREVCEIYPILYIKKQKADKAYRFVSLSTRVLKPLGMSTQMLHVRANDARLHVIPPLLIRPTSTPPVIVKSPSLSLSSLLYTR